MEMAMGFPPSTIAMMQTQLLTPVFPKCLATISTTIAMVFSITDSLDRIVPVTGGVIPEFVRQVSAISLTKAKWKDFCTYQWNKLFNHSPVLQPEQVQESDNELDLNMQRFKH